MNSEDLEEVWAKLSKHKKAKLKIAYDALILMTKCDCAGCTLKASRALDEIINFKI